MSDEASFPLPPRERIKGRGINRLPSSFRDPSGFLFTEDGTLQRSVSRLYKQNYDHLIQSGLYDQLVKDHLLIPHREVQSPAEKGDDEYKTIQPDIVPFISYPYEWCFSQLKDAALTTLKIQKKALDCNMSLKDASAYNIQFFKGQPILIDTLSFEIYKENGPWVAYRQFCQHFLAPLALMTSRDIRLGQLMRIYLDGLHLDFVSRLLPISTWFKPALLIHIHLHSKAQKRYEETEGLCPTNSSPPAGSDIEERSLVGHQKKLAKHALIALINHLESAITSMQWRQSVTEWSNYYEDTNYTPAAMTRKKQLVDDYLAESNPRTVWDLGANRGVFSRIATAKDIDAIAFDADFAAVEINYQQMRKNKEAKVLPLYLDLTNPSPSVGWANEERLSLIKRGPADAVLALALIHHLAISSNVPFSNIAAFFSQICRFLIVEFVPKKDSQVQRMLRNREDIFTHYNQTDFETSFGDHFSILQYEKIADTQRMLYLMQNLN